MTVGGHDLERKPELGDSHNGALPIRLPLLIDSG
jgi:hypothetical protein